MSEPLAEIEREVRALGERRRPFLIDPFNDLAHPVRGNAPGRKDAGQFGK